MEKNIVGQDIPIAVRLWIYKSGYVNEAFVERSDCPMNSTVQAVTDEH